MDYYSESSGSSLEDIDEKCRPCFVLLKRLDPDDIQKYTQNDQNAIDGGNDDDETEEDSGDEGYGTYGKNIRVVDLSFIEDRKGYLKKLRENRALKNSTVGESAKTIFSIFTLDDFHNRADAILSYYDQLKYAPYKCVKCDEATLEITSMIEHYLTDHEDESIVRCRTLEVPAKERWVRKFVDYQIAVLEDEKESLPNNIIHKYCPVCQHYDWKNSAKNVKSSNAYRHAVLLDKNHINKHLRYFPFVCTLCRDSKKRYSVTMINAKARDHLMKRHDFKRVTEADLTRYFKPVDLIPELENFLRDYVSIIHENTQPKPSTSYENFQPKDNRKKKKTCTSIPTKPQPNGKTGKSSKPKSSTLPKSKGKNGQKMRQQYEKFKRMRQEVAESDGESQKSDEGLNATEAPNTNQLVSILRNFPIKLTKPLILF